MQLVGFFTHSPRRWNCGSTDGLFLQSWISGECFELGGFPVGTGLISWGRAMLTEVMVVVTWLFLLLLLLLLLHTTNFLFLLGTKKMPIFKLVWLSRQLQWLPSLLAPSPSISWSVFVLYCTVLYCTVTVLYCTVPYCKKNPPTPNFSHL